MLVILSSVLYWLGVVGVRLGVGGEARKGKNAKQGEAREGRIGQGETTLDRVWWWPVAPIVGGKRKVGSGIRIETRSGTRLRKRSRMCRASWLWGPVDRPPSILFVPQTIPIQFQYVFSLRFVLLRSTFPHSKLSPPLSFPLLTPLSPSPPPHRSKSPLERLSSPLFPSSPSAPQISKDQIPFVQISPFACCYSPAYTRSSGCVHDNRSGVAGQERKL